MESEPVVVALKVARIFEALGIRYLVGGGVASTVQGEPRYTRDVDIALHFRPSQVEPLIRSLEESDFFFSAAAIRSSITGWNYFDLLHKKLFIKVDCYVRPEAGIHAEEIRRAMRIQVGSSPADVLSVATPEDTVIQKLVWYRMSDEVQDHQRRDVVGILRTWRGKLDDAYMDRWSTTLGVADLLDRVRKEAASVASG
jgi:hypothetical protein